MMNIRRTVLLVLLLSSGIKGFTTPWRRTRFVFSLQRRSASNKDDDNASFSLSEDLQEKDSEISKRDAFIRRLESQLDVVESELLEKSKMLCKRDQLIENLEEEISELENQLKSQGRFTEKKPPMKGRKTVAEDNWEDPLQDVQGSLLFHLAMTLRLSVVTVFYRIPLFIFRIPQRLLRALRE
jgi:uncharacterized FlgJ-related protein